MAQTQEHAQDENEHPSLDYRTTLIVISVAIVAAIILGVVFG